MVLVSDSCGWPNRVFKQKKVHFHVICTAFLRLIFHSEELLIFRQVGSFYPMLVHLLLAALWPVFYQLSSQHSSLKFNSYACNFVSILIIRIFGKLGTIHILRNQQGWVDGVGKMITLQYNFFCTPPTQSIIKH